MKDSPLIIGLLVGLIVVLVIAGVSLLTKMNSLSAVYKQELARNIGLDETIEGLRSNNSNLKKNVGELEVEVEGLKEENLKLEKLKDKLEENLKDELMKQKLYEE